MHVLHYTLVTLWDPELFKDIEIARRSQQSAVGNVFLNGHLYLQALESKLDNLECKLRNCMAQSGRYLIIDNAYMWIFTPGQNKEVCLFMFSRAKIHLCLNIFCLSMSRLTDQLITLTQCKAVHQLVSKIQSSTHE